VKFGFLKDKNMTDWIAFPYAGEFTLKASRVKKDWAALHQGDAEPLPKDPNVLDAWVLFHNGEFQKAAEAGLCLGGAGMTVANKATCTYANYLETKEKTKLDLFMEVAHRAEAQCAAEPYNGSAYYWRGYALARYGQGISVAKALAQGLGGKINAAFERAIRLQPLHADAHIALAAAHAEVIDKVGALIGGMTYGAKKETSLKLFQEALKLHPSSIIGKIEYANGLVMLEGDKRMQEATALYEQAAAAVPMDAMARLDVEVAKAELAD
jgi:tetratricopeptide (TPR) repeat protein